MALGEKIRQLDEQVAAAVRRALDDARNELRSGLDQAIEDLRGRLSKVSPDLPESFFTEDALRELAEETAPATDQAAAEGEARGRAACAGDLREALSAIDRARGQNAILAALVAVSSQFADRAAVLLLRPEGLVGWVARGFEADDSIRSASVSAQSEGWAALVQSESPTLPLPPPRCAQLVSQLDSPLPLAGVIIPLVLRDRVSAVVYADRTAADGRLETEALQVLTYATALALETLAFREREATSTLKAASRAAGAAAAPQPVVAPAPEAPPAPAPAEEEPVEAAAGGAQLEEVEDLEGETLYEGPSGLTEEEVPELPEETELPADQAEPAAQAEETEHAPAQLAAEPAWATEPEEEIELEEISGAAETDERLTTIEDEPLAESDLEVDEEGFSELPPLDELPPMEEVSGQEIDLEGDQEGGEIEIEEYELELEEDDLGSPATVESTGGAEMAEPAGAAPNQSISWQAEEAGAPESEPSEEMDLGAPPEDLPELPDLDEPPEAAATTPEPPAPPAAAPVAETAGEAAAPAAGDEAPLSEPAGGPVEPPADVEGPGWAFSEKQAAAPTGDDAAHDEARRLARLLVSEIQLYNQEEVAEGRRNNDIYERLKDDIDRSRQLYEERVDPGIRESTDYFYQELVRQLGAGDSKTLGI